MRSYPFAPIAAREYPSVRNLDHPYIWGGVALAVNVSEKPYSLEIAKKMEEKGIRWIHCPVSEKERMDWTESLKVALPEMLRAYKEGKKIVVHCDFGANRSRSFVEAFHYLIMGTQFPDEYKGEFNHLVYNCKIGHLPPLEETERMIKTLEQNG